MVWWNAVSKTATCGTFGTATVGLKTSLPDGFHAGKRGQRKRLQMITLTILLLRQWTGLFREVA